MQKTLMSLTKPETVEDADGDFMLDEK